jgi:hypothetical protein
MTNKFESMSDQELKQYFLQHRDDDSFHAYMDRRSLRPKRVLIEAGELDRLSFDEQVKIVEERMRSHHKTKVPDSKNS